MLRRRGGGAQFNPFVLPVKGKPASAQPQDDDEDAYEDLMPPTTRLPFLSFVVMEPERRAQRPMVRHDMPPVEVDVEEIETPIEPNL
ncbi:hypothetical protein PInf_019432 [Phytophthora infestans]|nr:hypothetical protein PInf_019432 [Phytophthora infestans]